MAWRRGFAALPLACLLGFVAAEQGATPGASFTEVHMAEQRTNATVGLHVRNRAGVKVRLVDCGVSHEVEAGAEINLKLEGLSGFWVVPDGTAWDCHNGPFDLFFVAANFSGPELLAGVGYGLAADVPEEAAAAGGNSSGSQLQEAAAGEEAAGGLLAGIELAPAGAAGAEGSALGCRVGACSEALELPKVPEALELTVLGPELSMLSRWYGYGRRWRYGGYRRRWYGGGYRRSWYGGYRPGYGYGHGWHGGHCYWWCHGCCYC